MSIVVQVWDINEPAPAALGDPVGLITASNAVHTCIDLPSAQSSERPAACRSFSVRRRDVHITHSS